MQTQKPINSDPLLFDDAESTMIDPNNLQLMDELRAGMTQAQWEQFADKMVECIQRKQPLMYNFKKNPNGFTAEKTEIGRAHV